VNPKKSTFISSRRALKMASIIIIANIRGCVWEMYCRKGLGVLFVERLSSVFIRAVVIVVVVVNIPLLQIEFSLSPNFIVFLLSSLYGSCDKIISMLLGLFSCVVFVVG
jgi:hypothetical protein